MQSSSRRYRSVVFSRKYIQSMEVRWPLLVGAWKTCVTLDLRYTTTPDHLSSRIKNGMECLFDADKPYFATWLWIHDEDRWGRSIYTERPEKPAAVPLYYAARFGFRELAEHLIAEHPEHVNTEGGDEVTPMHATASEGHANILPLLIEHGAALNGRAK